MSAFNLNKPIFSASFIIHYESASRCDASADSTAKDDPGLYASNDFIPQQQDSPEYDEPIIIQDEDEDEVYAEKGNDEKVQTKEP
nr:hypothetical protein [Tanacetum cinerariifolium]